MWKGQIIFPTGQYFQEGRSGGNFTLPNIWVMFHVEEGLSNTLEDSILKEVDQMKWYVD